MKNKKKFSDSKIRKLTEKFHLDFKNKCGTCTYFESPMDVVEHDHRQSWNFGENGQCCCNPPVVIQLAVDSHRSFVPHINAHDRRCRHYQTYNTTAEERWHIKLRPTEMEEYMQRKEHQQKNELGDKKDKP